MSKKIVYYPKKIESRLNDLVGDNNNSKSLEELPEIKYKEISQESLDLLEKNYAMGQLFSCDLPSFPSFNGDLNENLYFVNPGHQLKTDGKSQILTLPSPSLYINNFIIRVFMKYNFSKFGYRELIIYKNL